MKKTKFIKNIFSIFLFVSILCLNIMFFSTDVFASANLNELDSINDSIDETQNYGTEDGSNIFNNKTIKVCEYIYNLDDSADYIYIEFNEGGYVMLVANSFEIMEYSLQGNLPYTNFENKNYYLGPSNYFCKETNNYINLLTEDSIVLAEDKITEYSRKIRNILKINYNENLDEKINAYEIFNSISNFYDSESLDLSSPNIDTNNLIIPTLGTGIVIPNYQYFIVNPTHGNNYAGGIYGSGNSGTCASVAAQIFLGYNNYYNDRRIIEDRYLNGYDDSTNSIKYPDRNPNHCTDPNYMTRYTIGTRSEDTGENSFYSKVITTIMEPNTSGASLDETYEGIIDILNEKLSANDYTIDYELKGWFFGYSPVDSSKIKSEINAGRPVIISLSSNLGAVDHQVVGYGYQNYTYPGSSDTYEGYIVHFGWAENNCVWVNSSWCKGYISLQMNHTHNYNVVTDNIIDNSKIELRCGECGHRKLDELFVLSGNTIIDTKYDLIEKITIPSNINGIEVKGIGSEAFKNCTNLQEILIPNSVTHIDSSAFEDCYRLSSITLSNNLTSIGNSSFKDCASLLRVTIPNSVTNVDSSAFENCSYLQSVTLSNNLNSIGSSAFKGCASLPSITIPNTVTNIDSSAFENCSYLQSVILSTNLVAIGSSAFKGCGSLASVTIPNSVTNIDSSAFENCTILSNITLSNNLQAIGTSTFKGCTALSSVTLPKSVQYIDEEAFRNCSSLRYVTILKETSPITNLGQNVFTGCDSNLEIKVPINRLVEYKNKEYWSSYRNQITSDGTFEEINIDCETTRTVNYNLQQGLNKCYKINVDCVKSYRTSVISNNDVSIKLYNENMMFVNENTNMLDEYFNVGTYYVLFEYENIELNGLINVNFSLRWPNNFTQISYNVDTNILSNLHNTAIDTKHGKFCYLNNQGEGLYKITLNAGNITYPVESLMIYTDSNRTNLLNRYNNPEETIYATSLENENVMFVYLPSSGYYYMDVVLPTNNYSSVTLKIEKAETNHIDYTTSLSNICFDILFEGNSLFSNFEEVTISHRSKIQLDVVTSGSIFQNIKVVVLQKIKEPGYEPGDNHYYNVVKLEDYITTINRSPVFDIIFDPGTYYIGFINNSNHVSISMALRRLVNQEVDMNNTLVADPATNEGYTLGSEVTVNNGICNSDTITEGFTRCIYLMVENRLRDPMSRLEYDWYSSNENVAAVTPYGTVIAKSVNVDIIVTIYAVLKTDPSIVYRKTFTIINDIKTYATDPLDYYLTMTVEVRENELINLSSLNVPIDMTQYYNWSGSPLLNIDYWGYIYAEPSAQGMTFEVEGTYRLNSRVKIHLTVYVIL